MSSRRSKVSGCSRRCGQSGSCPGGASPSGPLPRSRLFRQRAQRGREFVGVDARKDADRSEVMPVELLGEAAQDRLVRVGGDAVDDQLVARDAKRKGGTILEQPLGTLGHTGGGGTERGMPGGVHRVLVERDRRAPRGTRSNRARRTTRSGLEMVSATSVGHSRPPDWEGAPLRVSVMREENFRRHCTELHVESPGRPCSAQRHRPGASFHAFSRAARSRVCWPLSGA